MAEEQQADEADVVRQAAAGNREAFALLYARYFDRIYDFLYRMLRSAEEAADVTQETFVKAMEALPTLASAHSFRSWLFTIARNLALNRASKKRRTVPLEAAPDEDESSLADVLPDPDPLVSPEAALDRSETARMVWSAAGGLEARQYAVLDLAVRQGLDADELSETLHVSRNNAYVLVNRMKRAFADAACDLVDFTSGRKECTALDGALAGTSAGGFTPSIRRTISRHARGCGRCQVRRARFTPLEALRALAPVAAPTGLRERIWEVVQKVAPIAQSSVRVRWSRGRTVMLAGSAAAAALAAALLIVALQPAHGSGAHVVPPTPAPATPTDTPVPTVALVGPAASATARPPSTGTPRHALVPKPAPSPQPATPTPTVALSPVVEPSSTATSTPPPPTSVPPTAAPSPVPTRTPEPTVAPSPTPSRTPCTSRICPL